MSSNRPNPEIKKICAEINRLNTEIEKCDKACEEYRSKAKDALRTSQSLQIELKIQHDKLYKLQ